MRRILFLWGILLASTAWADEAEDTILPSEPTTEFLRLNAAVQTLMQNSLRSYCLQKEFTENASHEMQTPLAVFQSKLDLLLQQPDLTEPQAQIIQELY